MNISKFLFAFVFFSSIFFAFSSEFKIISTFSGGSNVTANQEYEIEWNNVTDSDIDYIDIYYWILGQDNWVLIQEDVNPDFNKIDWNVPLSLSHSNISHIF